MRVLTPGFDLNLFFERVRTARCPVLLTDYDGTLAPFRAERDRATPHPEVREILDALIVSGRCRVVIVTGRAVDVVIPLLGLKNAPEIWGSHGWEHRGADGTYTIASLSDVQSGILDRAAADLVDAGLAVSSERKPTSVAVHVRGMSDGDADAALQTTRQLWAAYDGRSEVEVVAFDGGLELRASGHSKAGPVDAIVREGGVDSEPAICYLGDDLTDEDAYRALGDRGLRVLVRRDLRETAADLWLVPPDELIGFLREWSRACGADE